MWGQIWLPSPSFFFTLWCDSNYVHVFLHPNRHHPSTCRCTHSYAHFSPSLSPLSFWERERQTERERTWLEFFLFTTLGNDFRKHVQEVFINQSRARFSHKKHFTLLRDGVNNSNNKCFQFDVSPDKMFGLSGNSYLFPPVTSLYCVLLLSNESRGKEGGEKEREK